MAQFMRTVLTDHSSGYYMGKDVFGRSGDFITAPEISQLFGEMVALSFVSKLSASNSHAPVHLIELGPGRGTLMFDILRTLASFPSIWKRIRRCSLVEVSPFLRQIQKSTLSNYDPLEIGWYDDFSAVPVDGTEIPLILAQEFFDAIPVHVFKKNELEWRELLVGLDPQDQFCLVEARLGSGDVYSLQKNFAKHPVGATLEISPESWSTCHHIRQASMSCPAVHGLIIDYGHFRPSSSSLRAIFKHEFCGMFEHVGDADLSVDVDFQGLAHFLGPDYQYKFRTQGEFLRNLGIERRLEHLCAQRDASTQSELAEGVKRLIDSEQMGTMYKVLEFDRKC